VSEPPVTVFTFWSYLAGAVWSLGLQPGSYVTWARMLFVFGLPTLPLCAPLFFFGRRHGVWKGVRLVGAVVLAVLAVVWLALLGTSTGSQDLRTALRMLSALLMGFTTGIWAPLSIVAVLLGAWRREAERHLAAGG
jgi:hypothetical protein